MAENQNWTTPTKADFVPILEWATPANALTFEESALRAVPITDQPTIAVRPSNDSVVICHTIGARHAKQIGGSPADRQRLLPAQRCSFGRIIAQHQQSRCDFRHRRLHRRHNWRQSSTISAQIPGSPSRQARTRPGRRRALAANTSAISTMVSKIHPGIAPGQSKAVERDTERNAKVAIVRATHNLKGDQGSRLGYNDGNQSSRPSLMTRSS